MPTQSATKQVFLNPTLLKELHTTRKVSNGLDVCRILARVGISDEQVFDELQPVYSKSQQQQRDYLFVLPKEYKLQELQTHLSM